MMIIGILKVEERVIGKVLIMSLLFLFTSCNNWHLRKNNSAMCPYPIFYDNCNIMANKSIKKEKLIIGKTRRFKVYMDTICEIKLLNCKGRAAITMFAGRNKYCEAFYSSATGLNYKGIQVYNKMKKGIIDYSYAIMQPFRDSVWNYYNEEGNLIREEYWKKGVLIKNGNSMSK